MRYCLMAYNSENYVEITKYCSLSDFQNYNPNILKDIVAFTHHFVDELDLKSFLQSHNFIPNDLKDYSLGIAYFKGNNGKPKILQYGLSYEEDAYYYDITNLKRFLLTHLDDLDFMNAFLKKYYSYLQGVSIYTEDLDTLFYGFNTLKKHKRFLEDYQSAMASFFETYTTKKAKDNTYQRDYRKIRDLAMFVINYLNELNMVDTNIDDFDKELQHLRLVVNNGNITDEQREIYEKRMEDLENSQNIRRRKKGQYATTGY